MCLKSAISSRKKAIYPARWRYARQNAPSVRLKRALLSDWPAADGAAKNECASARSARFPLSSTSVFADGGYGDTAVVSISPERVAVRQGRRSKSRFCHERHCHRYRSLSFAGFHFSTYQRDHGESFEAPRAYDFSKIPFVSATGRTCSFGTWTRTPSL